jgi:RNA polymerase sigma factor (sigma-70 family)
MAPTLRTEKLNELNDFIIHLHSKQQSWRVVALKYGGGDDAEDVVQDSYIKLIEWYNRTKPETLTDGVFFFIVRNTALDIARKGKQQTSVDELSKLLIADDPESQTHEFDICKIHEIVKGFHWFDAMLVDVYFNLSRKYSEEITMRQISDETGISLSTIFNTIKRCKERIKEAVEK